ncbi:MAG TPA: SDR family oxidoreductase [Alphaproteobacteria bacterium]|jgi:3-hydroxy acid dehydrogenase/malonic semialdehyde reductase
MTLTVLITGATSGFGEATARLFAKHGHQVVITGRRRERLMRLADELKELAHPVPLDVRDEAAVNAAVSGLPAQFADIDVLVNNAGLALGLEPAQEAHIADWQTMIDTNINGLVYCTRAVLPGMVRRGRGHIVNIGSVAGTYPYPGGNVYGATKAFVHQFSLNLRADLLGKNIRVTCIEPGLSETEFSLIRFKGDVEKAKAPYRGVKPMTGDDIAAAVYFAVSMPEHVNVNIIEMMATNQAFGPFAIHRD